MGVDAVTERAKVRFCIEQLGALKALGYISDWHHHDLDYFTISTSNGGHYNQLPLDHARLLIAGLLVGSEGRETFVHIPPFDWGVLFTAIEKEETLMRDLDEYYSEDILGALSRIKGVLSNMPGFK